MKSVTSAEIQRGLNKVKGVSWDVSPYPDMQSFIGMNTGEYKNPHSGPRVYAQCAGFLPGCRAARAQLQDYKTHARVKRYRV